MSELEELVARHPLRERLRAQLMLALYRSGRQAEALELFRRTRETLVDELGIEPSPELQELERAILQHDPSLRPGRKPAKQDEPPPAPARRRLLLVLGAAIIVAAVAAGAAALALTDDASSSRNDDAELSAFVTKVENFLVQSQEGRRAVAAAIGAAHACKLSAGDAVARLNRVQRNRQSLLQQVAALSVPDDAQALQASDRFQKAAQASIAADWHYRDWLTGRKRCGGPDRSPDLQAARAADVKATRAKQAFLETFDPLAKRFHQRAWAAGEF